ncbi:MAG: hypothetical protein EOM20_20140 [Spartobacteria bacterium]|nr:hypothetical protein [Spartobacteria bacterium]
MAKRDVEGEKTGRTGTLGEIGKEPIEPVSDKDFVKAAELEDFMNQKLLIRVHEDNSPNALPVIVVSVNGVNQPIIRGQKQAVRRKYVEALARGTHTRYEQRTTDPGRPENIQMVERTAITYPFTVYEDPHKNGADWLESILRE